VKAQYSFLYLGYKMSHFYWEFVILYRKLLIAFISVYLANISVHIQALSLMLVLIGSLILQAKHEPFSEPQLNELEFRSIMTSAVTIYCGLFYLSEDLEEVSKLGLFVLILGLNINFVCLWLTSYSFLWLSRLAQLYPIFFIRYCWFYPDLVRQARDEIEAISLMTDQRTQPLNLEVTLKDFYIAICRAQA
jgi:hypothetical protein